MVAISLYRGNLHRVPDVPRRWIMPNRGLSMKSFKTLLNRRSRALTLVSNPNPNPVANIGPNDPGDGMFAVANEGASVPGEEATITSTGDGVKEDLLVEVKPEVQTDGVGREEVPEGEKNRAADVAIAQPVDKADVPIDREKRKKEVEAKLQVLNEKKHNLVQVLKQILNAEEELKRRSSMQSRPPPPLQVDVGNDSGSMNQQATPRIGSEANLGVDLEGGDSRPMLRMSSTSPSPDSLRRPALSQHNPLPHPVRTNLVSGSPSRFAPPGHPSVPVNAPSVYVPGCRVHGISLAASESSNWW
ncbi:hypothetical protein MLD38_031954 [Melastoma candidum]|uniref:Uncharacterized protein n=1 Tax=Melastoma candidum TaxID=119954 RepID=A0ACB9MSE6_9MYRT|nr:hypothetical protein MLD38_031954 [Melastoma candidum]